MTATKTRAKVDIGLLEKAMARWRAFPMEYVDDVILKTLGITLEPRQREALEIIFKYKKVLIPTHFSFGKSFICAIVSITLSNLYCDDFRGETYAPTFTQVKDIIWAEMRSIRESLEGHVAVGGKMTTIRYDFGPDAFMTGRAPKLAAKGAETPQGAQGKHARVVLFIIDEAGGTDKQIIEQIERSAASGKIVYIIGIGNPLTISQWFGQYCTTEKGEGYTVKQFKAYDAPNMIENKLTSLDALRGEAGRLRAMKPEIRKDWLADKYYKKPFPSLLSPGWVMEKYLKFGESGLFFSYLGEWSQTTTDTLVPIKRVNECMLGSYVDEKGIKQWTSEDSGYAKWNGIKKIYAGIDASGEGVDKNLLYALEGNRELFHYAFNKTWESSDIDYRGTHLIEDGPYIAKWIYDNLFMAYPGREIDLTIDGTGGFGKTIYDALMSYPLNEVFITIRLLNFASNASDEEIYHDIVAEMAFNMANHMKSPAGLLLEANDDLKNQITNRKTTADGKKRNMLESKKDYKQRAGSSPDDFDALIMAVYGDVVENTIGSWRDLEVAGPAKGMGAMLKAAGLETNMVDDYTNESEKPW
jgi:hypothetical protein